MIVVDTNIIAYLFIPGDQSDHARSVFLKDPEWCAPILWRSEFWNVLAFYIRKKLLSIDTAFAIAREAEKLMGPREFRVSAFDVLTLASKSICSAYDCEYAALANELHLKLVTADKQLLKAFPETAVSAPDFLNKSE